MTFALGLAIGFLLGTSICVGTYLLAVFKDDDYLR